MSNKFGPKVASALLISKVDELEFYLTGAHKGLTLHTPSRKRESKKEIALHTFDSDKQKMVKTTQTRLSIKLRNNQYLDINVNCSTN